jgi:hypothetical protein
MATQPLGHDSLTVTLPGTIPPMPAVARILSRYDRAKLEAFIAIAIDLTEALDGDPEGESATWTEAIEAREDDALLPDDSEAAGDEHDAAWTEWQTRGRHKLAGGSSEPADLAGGEDAEDDDPDTGVEDEVGLVRCIDVPGCPISDPDYAVDDLGCDENADDEIEQMVDDVPMLLAVTAEHNIFTDERHSLGISNLQTSFRTNGSEIRSADSGEVHRSTGWCNKPGTPV